LAETLEGIVYVKCFSDSYGEMGQLMY